jgi:predicted 3-demethylubiquinone-9 3-methyltransferase (glyoxalase superfamily)
MIKRIAPCLWFEHQAEEAAKYYISIFRNSKIVSISHYGEAGKEFHRKPVGSAMTVAFELDGQPFTALNGGPAFKFNEAVSLQINCETQQEVDYFWSKLIADGDVRAQQCGWLKDKFGVSWQVVPTGLDELLRSTDSNKSERVMHSLLQMKKLDIDELRRVYNQ